MDRSERFYRIEQLLRDSAAPVPRAIFLERLEVSLATFKRDLEYLRDRFGIPILWDPEARGYRIDASDPRAQASHLPRPWFNAAEVHALLTLQHLLEQLQPGLLGPHLAPLGQRIEMLLEGSEHSSQEVRSFGVEAIRKVQPLDTPARRCPRSSSTRCWARATAFSPAPRPAPPACRDWVRLRPDHVIEPLHRPLQYLLELGE